MKKIFLGPPGSGKGTAASRVAPNFNIPHISTGDLFRYNIKEQTPIGIKAKEFIGRGELVPDEVVIKMLKDRISQDDCKQGFILDGFPRTIPQAEKLHKLTEIDVVINMNVTEKVIIERLSSRLSCKDCGKIYNLRFKTMSPKKEGKCNECDGEVIQRDDDKPETIQNRLNIYKKQTQPLIDFYKDKGNIIEVVCDDVEQTPEQTFQDVMKAIKGFLKRASNL